MSEKISSFIIKDTSRYFWYYPWYSLSQESYRIDNIDLRQKIQKENFWINLVMMFPIIGISIYLSLNLSKDNNIFEQTVSYIYLGISIIIIPFIYYILIKVRIIDKFLVDVPKRLKGPNVLVYASKRDLIYSIIMFASFIGLIAHNIFEKGFFHPSIRLLILTGIGSFILFVPILKEFIRRYFNTKKY